MTSAAYPTVYAALVSTVTAALDPVRVVDGFDTSNDPGDVVMIGVADPADVTAIAAGSISQVQATMGTPRTRDETGTINGVAMAWNGDGLPAEARAAAFALVAEVEAVLRADPALGVTAFQNLVSEFSTGSVLEDKEDGATCAISFTVAYKARI